MKLKNVLFYLAKISPSKLTTISKAPCMFSIVAFYFVSMEDDAEPVKDELFHSSPYCPYYFSMSR